MDDVDDAFECECWCRGMDRIDDTDDDVDFRLRRPPEERRYEDRGVRGAGDAERRRIELVPEPCVETRGRGVVWADVGMLGWADTVLDVMVLGRRLESDIFPSRVLGDFSLLAFELGERARFDVSFIQFLSDKRWLIKGCFRRRLGMNPLGDRRSGLVDTTCNMLLRDLLLSMSFAGSGGRDDESESRR